MHIETEIFLYRYLNYYLDMDIKIQIKPDGPYINLDSNSSIYWYISPDELLSGLNNILSIELNKNKHMAIQKFKPGDKVKFTQEAKDRFDDIEYWHSANYMKLNLDKVYTIKGCATGDWPNYSLKEKGTAPCIAEYLLEPAEAEQTKKKNMVKKKDFILALVQTILPDQDLTYNGCKPYARVETDQDSIIVKCPKFKDGKVELTLCSVYGRFEGSDIKPVTKFLEQNCDLNCPEDTIAISDGDLVMCFEDYPWNMVSEIKPSTLEEQPVQEEKPSPCDNCEVVRKLQAEIQRLKYELDQAKAEKSQTSSGWCKKPKRATVVFEF